MDGGWEPKISPGNPPLVTRAIHPTLINAERKGGCEDEAAAMGKGPEYRGATRGWYVYEEARPVGKSGGK